MPETVQHGTWLLIDAAGPLLVTGLVRNGRWMEMRTSREGFLEHLRADIETLLGKAGLSVSDLDGCLYAAGPGSTLGLRLAAMFLKGLMELPALAHWRCLSYNNLCLACAGFLDPDRPEACTLLAPWRGDRFHRVDYQPSDGAFSLSFVDTNTLADLSLRFVALGNRGPRLPREVHSIPYPANRIPEILAAHPDLLVRSETPSLYTAETTEFARWNAERHTAQ